MVKSYMLLRLVVTILLAFLAFQADFVHYKNHSAEASIELDFAGFLHADETDDVEATSKTLLIEGGAVEQTLFVSSLSLAEAEAIEIRGNALGNAPLHVIFDETLDLANIPLLVEATTISVQEPIFSKAAVKLWAKQNSLGIELATLNVKAPISAQKVSLFASDTTSIAEAIEAPHIEILGEGAVQLLADTELTAKAGNIYIGGDEKGKGELPLAKKTFISSQAIVDVSATIHGDAGKVIIWSEEHTQFYGTINAKGGKERGNGGFVEVSSKGNLQFRGKVENGATNGELGTLLLDPTNIIIENGTAPPPNNDADLPTINESDGAGTTYTISEVALEGIAGDVILEATNDIIINNLSDDVLNLGSTGILSMVGGGNLVMNNGDVIQTNGKDVFIEASNITVGTIENNSAATSNIELVATAGTIQAEFLDTSVTGGANNAGHITLSATGNVNINAFPSIDTSVPNGATGNAGNVTIEALNITTKQILAEFTDSGPGSGDGGNVTLHADNNILINSNDAVGIITQARANGGAIQLIAGNTISLTGVNNPSISSSATSPFGNGGFIEIIANNGVTLNDLFTNGGGAGGDLLIQNAFGNVIANELNTSGANSNGGEISIESQGDITINNTVDAGSNGIGAAIFIVSTNGQVKLLGDIDANASFQGGNLTLNGFSGVTTQAINSNSTNSVGGSVTIESSGTVTLNTSSAVGGNIDVSGGISDSGGEISVFAEGIGIAGTGNVVANGGGNGTIQLATKNPSTPIKVGGSTPSAGLDLSSTDLSFIDQNSFREIIIGRGIGNAPITLDGAVSFDTNITLQARAAGGTFNAANVNNDIVLPKLGSTLTLDFGGDITIADLKVPEGTMTLFSDRGSISTVGANNLETNSAAFGGNDGGDITLLAATGINIEGFIDAGAGSSTGIAGEVYLTSGDDIQFGYIHADSDLGAGGNITVVTPSDVRAVSSANDALAINASVSSYGSDASGNILIQHNFGTSDDFLIGGVPPLGQSGTLGAIHANRDDDSAYELNTTVLGGNYNSETSVVPGAPEARLVITTGSNTKVSNNTSGGNWNNPSDWSPAGVPTLLDNVEIAAGNPMTIQAGDFPIMNSLLVNDDLDNDGDETIVVDNSLDVNNGDFDLGSGEIFVNGNITIQSTASLDFVDGRLVAEGSGTTLFDGSGSNLGELVFATNGNIEIASDIIAERLIVRVPTTLNLTDFNVTAVDGFIVNGTLDMSSLTSNQLTVGGNYIQNGTVLLNPSNPSTVTLRGTAGTVFVGGAASSDVLFDNLEVDASTDVVLNAPITIKTLTTASSSTFNAAGNDITIIGGGITNDIPADFIADGITTFRGTSTQTIDGSAAPKIKKLVIDNSNDLELSNNVEVKGAGSSIEFINGVITSGNSSLVQITDETLTKGTPNNTSHIAASVEIEFTSATEAFLPIGTGTQYGPIEISGASLQTYEAQYFGTAAGSLLPDGTTVNLVSQQEYWFVDITSGIGFTNGVTLPWNDTWRESDITDPDNLAVARFSGGNWSGASTSTTGGAVSGEVSTGGFSIPPSGIELTFGNQLTGTNTFGIPPLTTYYWVGPTGGAWDNPFHWAATSSGTPGAGVPVPSSTAIIDNSNQVIIDTDVTIANIEVKTGGNIEMQASASLIVTNDITMDVGAVELELLTTNIGGDFILNDGRIDADANIAVAGDVILNNTPSPAFIDFEIEGSFSVGNSLIVNGGSIELFNSSVVTISGDLLYNGGSFSGTGEYVLDGTGQFGNTAATPAVFPNNINFTLAGNTTLVSDVVVDGVVTLTGNLNTNIYELKVGDFPSTGDLIVAGGTIQGTLGYSIQSTGVYEYPFKDFPLTVEVTNVISGGELLIRFEAINPNPITEFTDNGDPITELFPEGTFRIESIGAELEFDITLSNYSVAPVEETTRVVVSNGSNWFGEGTIDGRTSRSDLFIGTGDTKRVALASSCSALRISPVVSAIASDTIACTFDELFFTLLGADENTDQVYRFYDAPEGGNVIDNQFVEDANAPNLFRPLTQGVLGRTFYVTITTPNGCESKPGRTPVTLALAPMLTSPELVAIEERFTIVGEPLVIEMNNTLREAEGYVVIDSKTDSLVLNEVNENGNIVLDQVFTDTVAFNEERLFESEVAIVVQNSEGCTSDTVFAPYTVVPLPEVNLVINGTTAENDDTGGTQNQRFVFCEGDLLEVTLNGKQVDRERYVILVDESPDSEEPTTGEEDDTPALSEVTQEFQSTLGENEQIIFERILPVGVYTYFITVEDTVYNVASPTPIQLTYEVLTTAIAPEVRTEASNLVTCENGEITVAMEPLAANTEYRWFLSETIENATPFAAGTQSEFTFQNLVPAVEDITEGQFYVATFNTLTECSSEPAEVTYQVLKQPEPPELAEKTIACEGNIVEIALGENDLNTPAGAAYVAEAFIVTKEDEALYQGTEAIFSYEPTEGEEEGTFSVILRRSYEINGERIECESLPVEAAFSINKRPIIASLETQATTCEEGGVLQLTLQLPTTEAGVPFRSAYALFITSLNEDGEVLETQEYTRTPDETGFLEIADLAMGNYTLQVTQIGSEDSKGNLCSLTEEVPFRIEPPVSPEILTETPEIVWNCDLGDFVNIKVAYNAAQRLNYQWYQGTSEEVVSAGTVINDTLSLRAVPVGQYTLIITAEGNNCQADTAVFEMIQIGEACETAITQEELENLCALKASLPISAQQQLNWPDCTNPSADPEDWQGVQFNRGGRVIALDLSKLGLEEVDTAPIVAFEALQTLDISENNLAFDDLEDVLPVVTNLLAQGQASVGEELNEIRNITQEITLTIPEGVTGTEGIVTWIFIPAGEDRENGEVLGTGIEITIENTTPGEDDGTYFAEITHPDFPAVVIFRSDINLVVTEKMIDPDREALETIYSVFNAALGGNNNDSALLAYDPDAPAATWPGVIQEFDRCVGLDLSSFNLIGSIPEEIGLLTALRRLSFFNNQLTGDIPESLGNLTNLTYLDLDKNDFSGPVSEVIMQLPNLNTLWLSRNNFTSLPESIGNLAALEFLLLQENELTALPQRLEELDNLKVLDVSGNKLTEFLPEIPAFNSLERLNLSDNQMTILQLSLSQLPNLQTLDLSDNNLTALPVGLPIAPSLIRLLVRRNYLDFADVEPLDLRITEYTPQKRLPGDETLVVPISSEVVIAADVEGTANQYQWFKDGTLLASENGASLTINEMSIADAGEYECLVTSSTIPDLTVRSRRITLSADCGETLQATLSFSGDTAFCANRNIFVELRANTGAGFTYQWLKDGSVLTLANDSNYIAFSEGNYQVQITAPSGCVAVSAPIGIRSLPTPTLTISLNNANLLTAETNGDSDAVRWLLNSRDTVGFGETFEATETGNYQAILRTETGCEVRSGLQFVSITSLADVFATGPLTLYPNPTNDRTTIDFPAKQREVTLTLRQLDGKAVGIYQHQNVEAISLNLEGLASGIYVLEISSEQGRVLKKVTKL